LRTWEKEKRKRLGEMASENMTIQDYFRKISGFFQVGGLAWCLCECIKPRRLPFPERISMKCGALLRIFIKESRKRVEDYLNKPNYDYR